MNLSPSQARKCAQTVCSCAHSISIEALQKAPHTVAFTKSFTQALCNHIAENGGIVTLEYRIASNRVKSNGGKKLGILDVFAQFGDGSKLAIEIDKGNKVWSLEKLGLAVEVLRAEAIWIRWRGQIKLVSIPPIFFVDLTVIGNRIPSTQKVLARERRANEVGHST